MKIMNEIIMCHFNKKHLMKSESLKVNCAAISFLKNCSKSIHHNKY